VDDQGRPLRADQVGGGCDGTGHTVVNRVHLPDSHGPIVPAPAAGIQPERRNFPQGCLFLSDREVTFLSERKVMAYLCEFL
jgi:hypothetical protein